MFFDRLLHFAILSMPLATEGGALQAGPQNGSEGGGFAARRRAERADCHPPVQGATASKVRADNPEALLYEGMTR